MTSTPTNPTLDGDRVALEERRDLGMGMARITVARAKADDEDGVEADRTGAFERINRGVRRPMLLVQFIARTAARAEGDVAITERTRIRARQQIIGDVE